MQRLFRLLVWGAISLPPILCILLSLLPADLLMLWIYGAVFWLFSLVILLLSILPVWRSRSGAQWRRVRKRAAIAFCIVVSVIAFNWPMRIAFVLSRPALNQAAQQLLAGDPVPTPRRIGLFRIEAAELSRGMMGNDQIPALWTDWTSPPSGDHMGFVQSGAGKPPFIMWSHMRLDGDWQFIYRAE